MLFHLANLPYWLFLGTGLVCFGLIIVAGDGEDDLDLGEGGLEMELQPDLDLPEGTDMENASMPFQLLGWLGFGKAPFLLLAGIDFSLWGTLGWMLNVWLGSVTGTMPTHLLGLGGLVLLLSLGLSLWLGRLFSRPIASLFVSFGQDVSQERLIGCVGTVTSKTLPYLSSGKIGQAHVYDAAGNLLTITVALPHWAQVIPHHNQSILIIDQSTQSRTYLAVAKDSSDEDKWLHQNLPSSLENQPHSLE